MRDILLVSRAFYPGGVSILECLVACTLGAFAAVTVSRFSMGSGKRIVVSAGSALCGSGALVCAAMIAVEILVFEFTVPLAVAAYAALGFSFASLCSQLRSGPPILKRWAESTAISVVAFGYLFFYGAVPPITELQPRGIDRASGANVLGRPGALPVMEFADFECPPCAVQDEIMEKIWSAYADRITYSFRHFPKARHPQAEPAALASQCAADTGTFWETKRLLFSNQGRLAEILARAELPTIPARETDRFAQCVQARSTLWMVDKDRESAANLGLKVTPSIVVGDVLIQGIIRYPRLALVIDRQLRAPGAAKARQTSIQVSAGCGSLAAATACSE